MDNNTLYLESMDSGEIDDIMESNLDLEEKMEALEYAEKAENGINQEYEQSRGCDIKK